MADAAAEEVGVMEAVVTAESLVDRSPAQLGLRVRYGVNLLALSRRGERIEQRPRSLKFRHAIFQELFLAEHVQGQIRRGDSQFLGRPEIDRTFSAVPTGTVLLVATTL